MPSYMLEEHTLLFIGLEKKKNKKEKIKQSSPD